VRLTLTKANNLGPVNKNRAHPFQLTGMDQAQAACAGQSVCREQCSIGDGAENHQPLTVVASLWHDAVALR